MSAPGARDAWCDIVNSFQNPATGFYWPHLWEAQNRLNWPWHPTHAAVETLALLNCTVRHELTDIDRILRNESRWRPFLDDWIANATDSWSASQQVLLRAVVQSCFVFFVGFFFCGFSFVGLFVVF